MTSGLDTVDTMLDGEAVALEGSGQAELYSIDEDPRAGPGAFDSMQGYASAVVSDPTIDDPRVNDLAQGLQAGVHSSSTEPVFDEHTTVNHPNGTAHYNDESGAWRDYEDSQE